MGVITLGLTTVGCQKEETGPAHTGSTPPTGPEWFEVASGADSGFLSIGGSLDDLWVVGADAGAGPAVYHYDGAAWTLEDTGTTGTLWWLWVHDSVVMMAGASGRVVTYDRGADTFTEAVLDAGLTFFGIWGSAPDDVWAIGGDSFSTSNAQLWHFDGAAWSQWTDIPKEFDARMQGFKLWGTGANDVWAVGSGMLTMHFDGSAWTYVPTPIESTTRSLFTVSGDGAGNVFAVGGIGDGTILRWDGAAWVDESPAGAPQFNGVHTRAGSETVACGTTGALFRRDSSGVWTEDERGSASPLDFHGCFVDEDSGVWGVGGYLSNSPQIDGFIVYAGDSPPATL